MSDLSQRYSRRPIARNNARRSRKRIWNEVMTLIMFSPIQDSILRGHAINSLARLQMDLERLYEPPSNRTGSSKDQSEKAVPTVSRE